MNAPHAPAGGSEDALYALYDRALIDAAASLPAARTLDQPTARAHVVSRLCGSTLDLDLALDANQVVHDFGLNVRACLLGQAAAALAAQELIGATANELTALADAMEAMIRRRGPAPVGKWRALEALAPVQDRPSRHGSTLLVFEALRQALGENSRDNA